jgi:hypothetical protein
MKTRFITTALLGALTFYPSIARAAFCEPRDQTCLNQDCAPARIGTSTMDFDKKNIVVCLLKNDGSGYKWKGLTQSQMVGIPASYPTTNTATLPIYDLNGFTGSAYCSVYTDASSNVYMRIISPWRGISSGWVRTNFLPVPITVYNQTTYCMADTTGIYFCNSKKTCVSKSW